MTRYALFACAFGACLTSWIEASAQVSGPARLRGTEAERTYIARRDPKAWPALLAEYGVYYAQSRRHSRTQRVAALYRALDIAALHSSVTGQDVGMVSTLGGRKLPKAYYVVGYEKFFRENFSRYRSSAASRRYWLGKTIVVAVARETCDLRAYRYDRIGQVQGRLADYVGGFYSPFKSNGFTKVALADSAALNDADVDYAIESCEQESSIINAFPRFVVHGRLICGDERCERDPEFLITHVAYAWSTGNLVGFLANTVGTTRQVKSVLQPLGIK